MIDLSVKLARTWLRAQEIFFWKFLDSAMYANFLILLGVIIAFYPTYRNVLKNPKSEPALPWFLWTFAFMFGGIVVLLEWDGKYENLAYPISMLLMHLGVGVISKIKNKVLTNKGGK